MQIMRPLACCHRNKGVSVDFDKDQNRVMTYDGLESCLHSSCSYDNDSADGCVATESPDEEQVSSCSSSSKEAYGSSSFSSQWFLSNRQSGYEQEGCMDDWEENTTAKAKPPPPPAYTMRSSDVDTMKERFAKILLGDDVSGGGCKGVSTALALSHAITNLATSTFGELWKLEPLCDGKKSRWRREMEWLLSPTNYMVELVPAKQSGANGSVLEIMTPKARSDVHTTLPALGKLDAMLMEIMDSMVNVEFWYGEGGSSHRGVGETQKKKRWWLPSPQVPHAGLSLAQRRRLGFQGKFVHQVLKASKSINDYILLQMPVPGSIKHVLPKSAKSILGQDVYRVVTVESNHPVDVDEVLDALNLKTDHSVLDIMNRLQGALFFWKHKLSSSSSSNALSSSSFTRKSPMLNSLGFMVSSELHRMEVSVERAESLLQSLKFRFPNLPHTFLDATKVQHNRDVGYSIIEAYSRALGSLAFSILSRIGDVLQEDDLIKPNTASPVATLEFDLSPPPPPPSLLNQINVVDDESLPKTAGEEGSAVVENE